MIRQNLLFCQFQSQEFQATSDLLCNLFVTSEVEISSLYQQIINDFNKEGYPPHFAERSFFQSRNEQFREIYEQSPVVAVDLPSIFELEDGIGDKPTVVVLGQDSKSDQDSKQIRIGTPYGLHHQGSRELLQRTKLYFDMICILLNIGYRVYLTDIYKVWVCNPSRPYYGLKLPKADRARFVDALELELSIFKPVAIVTWGKDSADSFSKLNLDLTHLKFPHPSGAANGTWAKMINQSPTNDNKLKYWTSVVTEFLK